MNTPQLVMSIDQGTTSTRAILFDHHGQLVSYAQQEHRQYYPRPGWLEQDPVQIWRNLDTVVTQVLARAGVARSQVAAIGVANQRETSIVWDATTGQPLRRAIVWQDTRSEELVQQLATAPDAAQVLQRSGLPLSSYFSAARLRWMLDHTPELRQRAENAEVLFGTMDTWLIWNLTGGADGGVHVTDVTNASRTQLMNVHTTEWDDQLLRFFGIPKAFLPRIRPSMECYGQARGPLDGVPVAAALGDQQAALFGQTCFAAGEAKCTYGTGAFLLLNTGHHLTPSRHGLLSTVAYQIGDQPAMYALEGPMAVTGSLVQWFRDGLGLIRTAPEIETLARTVTDNGGCYVVPAFYGLFAPRWAPTARGVICGMTSYLTKGHLARAVLEATGWQTKEVVDAVNADSPRPLTSLRVDGGMTSNNLLMQFLADALDVPVLRPMAAETVSLGAAYAAGLTVGYWPDLEVLRSNWKRAAEWRPQMAAHTREREYRNWHRSVELSLDWANHFEPAPEQPAAHTEPQR